MAAGTALTVRLDELVGLFNRRSLDLPDGLFDRRARFLLNGTAFEEMLGRSATDPLVLMIARGPAGYRFAVKALQHAVPDARIERGEDVTEGDEPGTMTASFRLAGRLRGSDAPINTVVRAALMLTGETVTSADVALDAALIPALRAARLLD